MKRYITFIVVTLTLSSCSVTEQDITRACEKVGHTPKYQASSVFVDELHKLEDKSGRTSRISSDTEFYFSLIKYKVASREAFSWVEGCKILLREEFIAEHREKWKTG